jgi:hypothetical protein
MKKILLGTTGLVGAALIATAASAETPKVTLGGFSDFQAGWTNDDRDAGLRDNAFRQDNTVTVKVDGKTDAGLGYGAQIDIQADISGDTDNGGTNANRTFTYLSGNWGRAELGGNKSIASTMRVDASTLAVATGGINGEWTSFVNGAPTTGAGYITTAGLPSQHGSTTAFGDESTYNATKINYYTPKFAGFQAGFSYTPDNTARGQTVNRAKNDGALGEVYNLGLSYDNQFSGVKVSASATGEFANAGAAASKDVEAYNVGALLGYKGFSVAGSYGDWSDSNTTRNVDSSYWTAGLGYEAGPVGLSATYLESTREGGTGVTDNDFQNIVVGADYKLAPGLTPYAEVSFYDFDNNRKAATTYSNSGTSVILGTQVAF